VRGFGEACFPEKGGRRAAEGDGRAACASGTAVAPAFDRLLDKALASVPDVFRPYLDNTVVVTGERLSRRALKEMGLGPRETLYGLYEGTPLTERGAKEPMSPDRIVIFRRPLVDEFGNDTDESGHGGPLLARPFRWTRGPSRNHPDARPPRSGCV
jgi:predicted Zn-dependent protease with MMP-like domain